MNFKTTLILLALLVVVGGYWFLFEYGQAPPSAPAGEDEDQPGRPLLAEAPDKTAIQRITIQRRGSDQPVVLAREQGQWQQVKPVRFPLKQSAVDQLISDMQSLRYLEALTPGGDGPKLASASLDEPRAVVTFKTEGQTVTLKLGDRYAGGMAYLMRGSDKSLYTVPRDFHDAILDQGVADWRQTQLAGPQASGAARISLRNKHGDMTLAKTDGQWSLNQNQRASQSTVSELADAVRNASIQSFEADRPEDMSLYGLNEPRARIALKPAGAATQPKDNEQATPSTVLEIGSATSLEDDPSAYFATWRQGELGKGVVFKVNAATLDSLTKTADDLRDPRIVTAEAQEVTRLKVDRTNQADIDVKRNPTAGFEFAGNGPGFAPDSPTVKQLIETITTTEASDYAPAPDQKEPMMTLALTHRGSGMVETVRLYEAPPKPDAADGQNGENNNKASDQSATQPAATTRPADSGAYLAVRGDEPVAYRIDGQPLSLLARPILALRKKAVLELAPAKLSKLTLRRDDGTTFTFQKGGAGSATQSAAATQSASNTSGDQTWQLQGHDAFERQALDELLQSFQPLRIKDWLHEKPSLGDEALHLSWTTRDGQTHTLRAAPDSGKATLSTIEPAFVLPDDAVEQLKREYRERTVLPIKSQTIEQVTVIEPGSDKQAEPKPAKLEALRSQLASYDPSAATDTALRITRDSSDRFVTAGDDSINQSAAGNLFDRLGGLEVKRYINAKQPGVITRRLRATTTEGRTFELVLFEDGSAWLHGQLQETPISRWFTLPSEARDELTAELTGQATGPAGRSGPALPGQGGPGGPGAPSGPPIRPNPQRPPAPPAGR